MVPTISLSQLANEITDTLDERFEGQTFWIKAEVSDVKKYTSTRRCYLKFIERENKNTVAELRGVFWSNSYGQIEAFEKHTKQVFADGIEITCNVLVRFHPKYGLNLDVLQIDVAYTLGTQEMERQQTLERLVKENPKTVSLVDGRYRTYNNTLPLPLVIQNIALITAPNSDGQRDLKQELANNRHGYAFKVTEFLTQIQGDTAHKMILEQLLLVAQHPGPFDAVAIVRGGGSQTDFKPFEDYDLSRLVAAFPVPIFTGIGHDRNTSIVDMMAREQKTPTKVAANIIDHNFEFENQIAYYRDQIQKKADKMVERAWNNIASMKRLVKMASPTAILNKGFAIVTLNGRIMVDPSQISENEVIETRLMNETLTSTVTKKTKNNAGDEL